MQESLEYFETVCQELSKNPGPATKWLVAFQDSEKALELSLSYLGMDFYLIGKFQ